MAIGPLFQSPFQSTHSGRKVSEKNHSNLYEDEVMHKPLKAPRPHPAFLPLNGMIFILFGPKQGSFIDIP